MSSHNSYTPVFRDDGTPFAPAHLPRSAINPEKWDACVRNSLNETPMAYSWVLDHLNPGWEAIVFGDYEGVMPLPVSHRLGMKMIQMPHDMQNLGLFSSDPEIVNSAVEFFKSSHFYQYRFINYSLMPGTNLHNQTLHIRNSFELNLSHDYQTLHKNYSSSHKKNIRRFNREDLSIEKNQYPEGYKELCQKMAKTKPMLFCPPEHNKKFNQMVAETLKRKSGEIFTISINGIVAGAAFSLYGKKRVVVFHSSNDQGRAAKTTFGLIDHFIRQNAGKELTLDFAGSDIPGIADFNRGFGATHKHYLNLEINRLPPLIKEIKETHLRYKLKRLFNKFSKR